MDVSALPKTEAARMLRARTQGLDARRSSPTSGAVCNWLEREADQLERSPGRTLAEVRELARADTRRLSALRNAMWTGVAALEVGGFSSLIWGGKASFVVGGLAAIAAGVAIMSQTPALVDKIRFRESDHNTAVRAEHYLKQPPVKREEPESLLINPLTSADPEHTKAELVDVLQATDKFLDQRAHEPGMWTAQLLVKGDLSRFQEMPGATLREMKDLAEADTATRRRSMKRAEYASYAFVVAGGACPILIGGPLGWVGLGLGAAGMVGAISKVCFDSVSIESNASRVNSLNQWSMQLDSLKEFSGSRQVVEKLAAGGPRGTGVEKGAGFLNVGGVRIPVKR